MNRKEFKDFIEQKCKEMLDLFDKKNKEYGADGSNAFHNFDDGYQLSTANSSEEFAWDLRCKHLQSIKDIITKKNQFSKAQADEKFGDDILYGFIVWGIVQKYYQSVEYPVDPLWKTYKAMGMEPPVDVHKYFDDPKYRLTVDELIKRD